MTADNDQHSAYPGLAQRQARNAEHGRRASKDKPKTPIRNDWARHRLPTYAILVDHAEHHVPRLRVKTAHGDPAGRERLQVQRGNVACLKQRYKFRRNMYPTEGLKPSARAVPHIEREQAVGQRLRVVRPYGRGGQSNFKREVNC
jgi:hypothetical protein